MLPTDQVEENLNVLIAMVTDIVNSLPEGEPTDENYCLYQHAGEILIKLGRSMLWRGHTMNEYYHAYLCGDYDADF